MSLLRLNLLGLFMMDMEAVIKHEQVKAACVGIVDEKKNTKAAIEAGHFGDFS